LQPETQIEHLIFIFQEYESDFEEEISETEEDNGYESKSGQDAEMSSLEEENLNKSNISMIRNDSLNEFEELERKLSLHDNQNQSETTSSEDEEDSVSEMSPSNVQIQTISNKSNEQKFTTTKKIETVGRRNSITSTQIPTKSVSNIATTNSMFDFNQSQRKSILVRHFLT